MRVNFGGRLSPVRFHYIEEISSLQEGLEGANRIFLQRGVFK